MPFLLAKVAELHPDGGRWLLIRGERQAVHEPADLRAAKEGSLVLLRGTSPPWSGLAKVHTRSFPAELPTVHELWRANAGHRREDLGRLTSHGEYVLDDRGRPCEVGRTSWLSGPIVILNYAGWRLEDFPRERITILLSRVQPSTQVWIVPPASVTEPRQDSPPPGPPPGMYVGPPPTRGGSRRARTRGPVNASGRPGWSTTRRGFAELEFGDGYVAVEVDGTRVTVATELAHELYQEVRVDLAEELPAGVVLHLQRGPGGEVSAEIEGLEPLREVFERLRYRRFVRAATSTERWMDADDLAERLPGGRADLLSVDEFGLGRRAEAFRRLFAARDRSERTRILPGRAVLVPLPASDGGPTWFAWETVAEGLATYLFRPATDDAREAMFAWTQAGELRTDLLGSADLQRQLGFVRRVVHAEGEDANGRWWLDLSVAIGSAHRG